MVDDVTTDATPVRGFPAPWVVVEESDGFRVEDANGLVLAWTAFCVDPSPDLEDGPLTRAEARRIAKAIAMVPEMRTIIRSLQDGLTEADADGSDS